jgi:hypothetical protein
MCALEDERFEEDCDLIALRRDERTASGRREVRLKEGGRRPRLPVKSSRSSGVDVALANAGGVQQPLEGGQLERSHHPREVPER